MRKLIFATNNQHKLEEIQNMLGDNFQLLSLADIGFAEEIPEDYPTLEGNASQKANYVFSKYKIDCFADDTGLEIEALNNEPGVYSARYAGLKGNGFSAKEIAIANMNKVLLQLGANENRKARFRTVISLIENGCESFFEGEVNGNILLSPQGENGFGYDPIFMPNDYNISFAEMEMDVKNRISHRGKAFEKMLNYLKGR